jgi:hypothetical protein
MNSGDPLAQLRDIHTPSPIDWWPPGPGWWLLLVLTLALLITLCVVGMRWYRANAYRRAARAELLALYQVWQQSGDDQEYLRAANSILKRTAIAGFKASAVQRLSGAHWCEFLDKQWRKPVAQGFGNSPLVSAIYQQSLPACDIPALHTLAARWIKLHKGDTC